MGIYWRTKTKKEGDLKMTLSENNYPDFVKTTEYGTGNGL